MNVHNMHSIDNIDVSSAKTSTPHFVCFKERWDQKFQLNVYSYFSPLWTVNIDCSEFGLHFDLRIGGIILGGLVDRNKEYKAQQSTINVRPFSIADGVSSTLFVS